MVTVVRAWLFFYKGKPGYYTFIIIKPWLVFCKGTERIIQVFQVQSNDITQKNCNQVHCHTQNN